MGKYFNVIVSNKSRNTDQAYTYEMPEGSKNQKSCHVGKRVIVLFNGKLTIGLIIAENQPEERLLSRIKPILAIVDAQPILSSHSISLAIWIRHHYLSRYNDAFSLFMQSNHHIKVMLKNDGEINSIYPTNVINQNVSFKSFSKAIEQHNLSKKLEEDILDRRINLFAIDQFLRHSVERWIRLTDTDYLDKIRKNSFKQKKILDFLCKKEKMLVEQVMKVNHATYKEIKRLEELKLVEVWEEEKKNPETSFSPIKHPHILTEEQSQAVNKILEQEPRFLIHGVTGSGKTEVYIQLVEHMIEKGKSVIYLVPEISLTPQTIRRFKNRFGNRIAIIHSKLTAKQKSEQWIKILMEEADIIIGARSALFAPAKNLGMIIIDESHEESYRSSNSPKYDTIEVAEKLSQLTSSKLVLGTATPDVSTYLKAKQKKYVLIAMKNRVNDNEMPQVCLVDMRKELEAGNTSIFGKPLMEALVTAHQKGEQAILFLNRRGFSSHVACRSCGHVVKCEKCDVSMTYHNKRNMLICHYCGRAKKMTQICPECGSKFFRAFGIGTEKVELELSKLIPSAKIKRVDLDTLLSKDEFENIYHEFRKGHIDMLVGTQILAKGLHFPNVTLVGVISADQTINLPFYTSNERAYQLITQVSGRAGRGYKAGKVFIQTYEPDHYSIQFSKGNDYEAFARRELSLRKEFQYPPYIDMISITFISLNESVLHQFTEKKFLEMKQVLEPFVKEKKILLYPPMRHAVYRVNNKYRISVILKLKKSVANEIKAILREIVLNKSYKDIDISIDINPTSII